MPDRQTEQELRREATQLHTKAQDLVRQADEGEIEWNTETENQFDALMEERAKLEDRARSITERRERLRSESEREERREEEIDARLGMKGYSESERREIREDYEERKERYNEAFWDYLRNGRSQLSRESLKVFQEEGRPAPPDHEVRASDVTVGTSNQGGVFAPTEFEEDLFREMKDFGAMRQTGVRVLQTEHGRDIEFPTMTDASNTGGLVSEASTNASVSNADLDLVTVGAHKYQSGPFALSREFLADSRLAPEQWIRDTMRERLGRITEKHYIDSTGGSGRPQGLIKMSTGALAIAQGSSNLAFGSLYDLKHSVDRAHRARGAEWLFTDQTFKVISKLTDSNGNFLLQPRVTEDAPQMLLGAPVRINNSSTAIEFGAGSTGAKPIWYGDFSQIMIRDVLQVVIRRLDERFALTDQVGFVGFMRTDQQLMVDPNLSAAQKPVRCIAENT